MAEVRPFRGLCYNPALANRMEALMAPPYDVIPPERAPVYRGRDPHNVIHLELPEPGPLNSSVWVVALGSPVRAWTRSSSRAVSLASRRREPRPRRPPPP